MTIKVEIKRNKKQKLWSLITLPFRFIKANAKLLFYLGLGILAFILMILGILEIIIGIIVIVLIFIFRLVMWIYRRIRYGKNLGLIVGTTAVDIAENYIETTEGISSDIHDFTVTETPKAVGKGVSRGKKFMNRMSVWYNKKWGKKLEE